MVVMEFGVRLFRGIEHNALNSALFFGTNSGIDLVKYLRASKMDGDRREQLSFHCIVGEQVMLLPFCCYIVTILLRRQIDFLFRARRMCERGLLIQSLEFILKKMDFEASVSWAP